MCDLTFSRAALELFVHLYWEAMRGSLEQKESELCDIRGFIPGDVCFQTTSGGWDRSGNFRSSEHSLRELVMPSVCRIASSSCLLSKPEWSFPVCVLVNHTSPIRESSCLITFRGAELGIFYLVVTFLWRHRSCRTRWLTCFISLGVIMEQCCLGARSHRLSWPPLDREAAWKHLACLVREIALEWP